MTLTEQHRRAQLRIGAATVLRMQSIWRLLDPDALDTTFPEWATAAGGLVSTQRALSARTAAVYLGASKTQALGLTSPLRPVLDETPDARALTISLLVTGPLSIKRAMTRGLTVPRAVANAQAASSAAAMRHSLEGGRRTIISTLQADPDARGWRRVASANACTFCSKLAGKFHRDDTAGFEAHDGCSCSQEPVWG